jgi:gluconate 5-dehydrogenase
MTDRLFSVADQIVLVSGGSRGIGRGLAQGFAERDARVIITGREAETLQAAAVEISIGTHPVETLVCDVAEPAQIDRTVAQVVVDHGRIDTLVNVAGVNKRQRIESYTLEEYDFIVNINQRGAFYMAQQVGRQMLAQGHGSQIHIDSLNSDTPLPGVGPYAMSKSALKAMTRVMATEWGPRGVRVNGLAPGFILTPLTEKLWSDPTMQQWGRDNTPQQRLGTPEDLVGAAIFLASEASRFLTGQVIYVDGGMISGMSWPIPLD